MKDDLGPFIAFGVGLSAFTMAFPICTQCSPAASATGVLAVAPQVADLGTGWTERKIVWVIDPSSQPPEMVNDFASRNPTNRAALLQLIRKGMQAGGADGTVYIAYGHGNMTHSRGRYDLRLSRCSNRQVMEARWSASKTRSVIRAAPKVGQEAFWKKHTQGDHVLAFRQGAYLAEIQCTVKQSTNLVVDLARRTVEQIVRESGSRGD